MVKSKDDYFEEKKTWSLTKDSILSCYLTPYFTKVLGASRSGLVYVDGFSGPGKFVDGADGSPLIAINKLREACAIKRGPKPYVQLIFAESSAEHRLNLESNIRLAAGNSGYLKGASMMVVDSCDAALEKANSVRLKGSSIPSSYFLYIDPYGIKDLNLNSLFGSPNMLHTEVLLNFSSVGFLRDACAALKVARNTPREAIDYSLPMTSGLGETERTSRLDSAIGCSEWRDIVYAYENGLPYWEAERQISSLFCTNASKGFRFVTNMPVKDMSSCGNQGLLKYRLVHMTNNPDGCILMNDNMIKRNRDMQTIQRQLFLVDIDGQEIDTSAVIASMKKSIESYAIGEEVSMWQVLAPVVVEHGVFMGSTDFLKTYLKPFLDDGTVERVEKLTRTGRLKTAFSNGSKLMIRRVK